MDLALLAMAIAHLPAWPIIAGSAAGLITLVGFTVLAVGLLLLIEGFDAQESAARRRSATDHRSDLDRRC